MRGVQLDEGPYFLETRPCGTLAIEVGVLRVAIGDSSHIQTHSGSADAEVAESVGMAGLDMVGLEIAD